MKRNYLIALSLIAVLSLTGITLNSCRTFGPGETKTKNPCAKKKHRSTRTTFRYSSFGESRNESISKKMAMSEARAGLASLINTTVKSVTDNYVKSGNYENAEEVMSNYQGLAREVVNQSLMGSRVICEKSSRTKQGTYKHYICLEIKAKDILYGLDNRYANNAVLKSDYNYERFRRAFEREMDRMEGFYY